MYCLSHFCCCCLKQNENLTNINSLDTDEVSFKDKFKFCQLETIDDDIPQLLCQKCCDDIQFMYQFKRAYSNCQKILKNYIAKLKSTNFSNNYGTLQISVLNVDPFVSIYKKHDINEEQSTTQISNNFFVTDNEIEIHIKDEKLQPEIINNDTSDDLQSEYSFTDNNNYEIVNETHINDIVKKLEPKTINNDNYEIVQNGDNNVLKIVRKKDDLKITLRRSSLNDESSLKCITCNSSFINNKLLRQHEKIHHKQTFKCKICSRIMHNKYTYRNHFGRHFGVYKFQCTICNKGLSSKQSLINHTLNHYNHLMKLKNNKQTNDSSVTVEKDGITLESAEKEQSTLGNSSDGKKINTPIRINIKRNKIISNTAVRKRQRQRRVLLYKCAMCQNSFPSTQKLFRHFKVRHNCV